MSKLQAQRERTASAVATRGATGALAAVPDFDRIGEIARMMVLIDAWADFATSIPEGETRECIVGGVRAHVAAAAAQGAVSDLIEARDPLLCQDSPEEQERLMRRASEAFKLTDDLD
jgi:hypothetical protein